MKHLGLISLILVSFAGIALAQEGHGGHDAGIPWKTIGWQVFNLTILFAGLIYFIKDNVRVFFASRKDGFVEQAKKSQAARAEAEKQYLEIQHKIEHLESTREESMARAQAEAADLRKSLIKEAEELAARVRNEAQVTAKFEIAKAKKELHEQFVQNSVTAARQVLTKDIGAADHQRLQGDFMTKVEGVRP